MLLGFGVSNFPNEKVVDVESLTVVGSCPNTSEVKFNSKTTKRSRLKWRLWLEVFKCVIDFSVLPL